MRKITDNKYLAPLVLVDSPGATIAALLFLLCFCTRSLPDMGFFFFPSGEPVLCILFLPFGLHLPVLNQPIGDLCWNWF